MKTTLMFFAIVGLLFAFYGQVEAKGKKKTYEQAKKECLAENPSMSDKKLRACIRKKRR